MWEVIPGNSGRREKIWDKEGKKAIRAYWADVIVSHWALMPLRTLGASAEHTSN